MSNITIVKEYDQDYTVERDIANKVCLSEETESGYVCTRAPYHEGYHVAHCESEEGSYDFMTADGFYAHILSRWPNLIMIDGVIEV